MEIDKLETEEQVRSWVLLLIEDMQHWRTVCNVYIPNPTEEMVSAQQKALWKFLQKQGKVIGALQALLAVRKINEVAYNEFYQKALNSLAPTIVGSI